MGSQEFTELNETMLASKRVADDLTRVIDTAAGEKPKMGAPTDGGAVRSSTP